MIKPKSIQNFLNEAPSLKEKITHEEFIEKKAISKDSEEISIKEAYNAYRKILEVENTN